MQRQVDDASGQTVGRTRQERRAARAASRINWVRLLHTWHWMSSAVCLLGLVMFSVTGLTLNNATLFEASEPRVVRATATVPAGVLKSLVRAAADASSAVPNDASTWLSDATGLNVARARPEWREDELSISMPRPGGTASVRVDLKSGQLETEKMDRGVVAYLNDLHKGRHAGAAWSWFIDLFAVAALVSALSGLFILYRQSSMRRSVWPLVALGIAIPVVVAIVTAH